jgi:hypothetical protein
MILRFISLVLFCSTIFALPLKDQDIIEFIEARYAGADSVVYSMISEDFIYFHTPYVGLGISTEYQDGSLLITQVVDDSSQTMLAAGDRIHEINGKVVTPNGPQFHGKVGEQQILIVTKKGDSSFVSMSVPLIQVQFSQNDSLFLNDIVAYANSWHDFHVEILDIILEKEKIAVHYHWEGSREEGGPVFHFFAMEMIYIDRKTDLITKVESLWSEMQFRDQFK